MKYTYFTGQRQEDDEISTWAPASLILYNKGYKLSADNWTDNQQVITDPAGQSGPQYEAYFTPQISSMADWNNNGVYLSHMEVDTSGAEPSYKFVFKCDTAPTNDIALWYVVEGDVWYTT